MSQPTAKQMLNRMTDGHYAMLVAVRDGKQLDARTQGQIRGYLTIARTLGVWGAVEAGKVSPLGTSLIAMWSEKQTASRPAPKPVAWVETLAGEYDLDF